MTFKKRDKALDNRATK